MPESRLESSGLTRQDDTSHTVPDAFGRYRVMHQIGVGVLGPLFRAADPDENRAVAVKAFRLDFTPEQTERCADALADVVAVGLDDPAILAPLDSGTARGMPYLVSEYLAGDSLDVVLRTAGGWSANAAWLVASIADAVDAAHKRGIVHGALHMRDVIVAGGRARVTGFGVASVLEHVGFRAPVRRPYAAPELVTGRRWGPEADRYAVAAMAYELLTGLRATGTDDHLLEQLRTAVGPDIPDISGLQQAFRNGLADDPGLRPASAAGFAASIAAALGVDVQADAPSEAVVESPAGTPAARPAVPPAPPDPGADDDFPGLVDAPTRKLEPAEESVPAEELAPTQELAPAKEFEPAGRFELVPEPAAPTEPEPVIPARSGPAAGSGSGRPARRDSDEIPLFAETLSARDTGGRALSTGIGIGAAPKAPNDRFAGVEDAAGEDDAAWTRPEPERSGSTLSTVAVVVVAVTIGVALSYFLSAGLGESGDAAVSEDTMSATFDGAAETAAPGPSENLPGAAGGVEREWSEARVSAAPPDPVEDLPAAELVPAPPPVDDPAPAAAPVGSAPVARTAAAPPVARPEDPEPAVPAARGPGELFVDTRPPGATVLIDGATVGVTPLLVPDVAPGAHRVRIELAGYRPWLTDVTVPAAERVRVGASLQPGGD